MKRPLTFVDLCILVIATAVALIIQGRVILSLEKRVAKIESTMGVKNAK